uniref:Uncharacterized protein n=1 Tax=Arundo donax TaxID=35708 RepID=A0A0A9HLW2_ARUDO
MHASVAYCFLATLNNSARRSSFQD